MTSPRTPTIRLDDLHKMVAFIYSDKNLGRPATATFTHFVEVCGMLTIHDRRKKRESVDVGGALCKALGWYFPLLAKMGIASVEELVFRKFPSVCPYCRLAPHDEVKCKLVRGTSSTVDHGEVARFYNENWDRRPVGLNEWQDMFQAIYPRRIEENGRSTIGLLEELGELAEAVRVYEAYPKYFVGEAADTFSYIMGIANEHRLKVAMEGGVFSFEEEFLARYPGLCLQCGSKLCTCPSIPEATVGRLAKEMDVTESGTIFISNKIDFSDQGEDIAGTVLEHFGGHEGLSAQLPFDRGDANRALSALCLRIAAAVDDSDHHLAEKLRAEALRITSNVQMPGTRKQPMELDAVLTEIGNTWKVLSLDFRDEVRSSQGLIGELGAILDTVRVLYVFCGPEDQDNLRLSGELRIIQQCSDRADARVHVIVDPLPAATVTDFRRKLQGKYDLIHFSGHADDTHLAFEDEQGATQLVPISAIAEAINRNPAIQVVILNACSAAAKLPSPMSQCTIGMLESVDDKAALEFTRGFYDAVVAGQQFKDAYQEGITAVRLGNHDASPIVLIQKN